MTDLEYTLQAEALLASVEAACDRINEQTEADVDVSRSGGMITLTFENRSQIVINLQRPLREVWMASKEAGHHYRFLNDEWIDSRRQSEFLDDLSVAVSRQSGVMLNLKQA